MIRAHRAPGGPIQFYNEVLEKLRRESQQSLDDDDDDDREFEPLSSDGDIDVLTRCQSFHLLYRTVSIYYCYGLQNSVYLLLFWNEEQCLIVQLLP